jgi:hypothetical protein
MSDIVTIETWIAGTLIADAGTGGVNTLVAGRIYTDEAPPGSYYPLVLISAQSSALDIVTFGPTRKAVNALYWVRVVGKGASKAALVTIADRIEVILQGARPTATSPRTDRRSQIATPPFTTDGVRYVQLGGVYEIYVAVP